jgi:hypothetical protein
MVEILADASFSITDELRRHARYAVLAAVSPVHHIVLPTGQLACLVTGYEKARQALHDTRLVMSEPRWRRYPRIR